MLYCVDKAIRALAATPERMILRYADERVDVAD